MFCCGAQDISKLEDVESGVFPHFKEALDNIAVARDYFDQVNMPTMLVYMTDAFSVDDLTIPKEDPYHKFYRQRLSGNFEVVCKTDNGAFDVVERFNFDSHKVSLVPSDLKARLDMFYPGVKNLIISGFSAAACVKETVKGAFRHGYKVYMLQDCVRDASDYGLEQRPIEEAALNDFRRYGAWVGTLDQLKNVMSMPGNDLLPIAGPKL